MQNQDFSYLYTEEERARFDWCRREQGSWNYRPLISIVVPVYKTPVRLLDEMIGSAIRQSYPQWELCIANASPEDRQLCEALAAGRERTVGFMCRSWRKTAVSRLTPMPALPWYRESIRLCWTTMIC